MTDEKGICCFCGMSYGKYGNNPEPLVPFESCGLRCCDTCNWNKVIPARLKAIRESQK